MSGLSLPDFADRIGEIIPVIMKEFVKIHGKEFHSSKITMPQFFVLESIHRTGECKMGDIAKFLSVTTAAITGIVDRLVRDGYVLRVSDPRDRRIIRIGLTAKGDKTAKNMLEKRRQVSINMFGMISQKEREEYLKILTTIKDKIQEQQG